MKISENTAVSMPMRNLISIIGAVAVGCWFGFGVIERLNVIETEIQLMQSDLEKNTEFRIKWPRGELGSLPADSEQFMLIEYIGTQIEAIEEDLKDLPKDRSQDLTINFVCGFENISRGRCLLLVKEKNKKQFEMVDLVSSAWTIQVPRRIK